MKYLCFLVLLWPALVYGQSVNLAWDAPPSTNVVGYRIYRSQTPSVSISNPLAMVTGLTYTDPSTVGGEGYWYAVTAVSPQQWESVLSNVVMTVAAPLQASTLKAYFQGLTSDRLGPPTTAPDGYPDWLFQVTGLRSNPARVVITMSDGRQWEAPFRTTPQGYYWLVYPEYPLIGMGNFWVSAAGEYESALVKVFYSDGTTDEARSVKGPPPQWIPTGVLPVPTGLNAVCALNGMQATLSWSPVQGATSYYVRLNSGGMDDGTRVNSAEAYGSTGWVVSITPGKTHTWWVHGATSPNAIGPLTSAVFTCTGLPPPPPPPPPDPCVVTPMRVVDIVQAEYFWPIGGTQSAKFTDNRGCSVTVNQK